jgi:Clp amino terminal domain, pathogenicity island component
VGVFERFTEETREVVRGAQHEARTLGHGAIGTEHLVLALTGVTAGIVVEVFAELGITSDAVRDLVRERLGPGPDRAASGQVPFSPLAKRALELSMRESLSCGDRIIRPEHLLLAISGMDESGGSEILGALGADPDRVGRAVRERVRVPVMAPPIGFQSTRVREVVPTVPPPRALPDGLLQTFLAEAGGRAWVEERERFGLEDLLRVCVEDERVARLLGGLGVDVDVLRDRLRRRPPAA